MTSGPVHELVRNSALLRWILLPALTARRLLLKHRRAARERICDSICDLLVEDPVVRVPAFRGTFEIDCRSDLFRRLVIERHYEPDLVQHCIERLDKTRDAVDVGANIGLFTVLFAKTMDTGRVLAIEPARRALSRFHRNVRRNSVQDRILVFEGVASNIAGQMAIKTVPGREEYSTLGEMKHPSVASASYSLEWVAAATLDDLASRYALNVGFVKVDVEGSEHLVFEGATRVLAEHRPVILSELSDFLLKQNGSSAREVIRRIESYGYRVVDAIDPQRPAGRAAFGDILCLPR